MAEQVVVVGGGLAGLSVAARLARHGCEVTLLEKAPKLGGRALTIPLKGFNFNFGAHAIYGRDRSALRKYEQELGLKIDWRPFSPHKVFYDLGEEITPLPANLATLLRTRVLDTQHKLLFVSQIVKTILDLDRGEPGVPIGEFLRRETAQVRTLLLDLASSNFFTNQPERIPSELFFDYYRRLFTSARPVSYIGGGWQSVVDGLAAIATRHGAKIIAKEHADRVEVENGRVTAIHGREATYRADRYIFCVPPKQLVGLFGETPHAHLFEEYDRYQPNEVVVYDIGLQRRIPSNYTYIYSRQVRAYITDISYYDRTCVPEGGQLLQAVAYLNPAEIEQGAGDQKLLQLEALYDRHFAGWRDVLEAKRVSKRATVQEIKCLDDQRLMPVKLHSLANAYFAGDWCEGEGQLSELSFSSAYRVSERILNERVTLPSLVTV